ncbi:accessory gland protein Acp29AB [Drosophila biarmipes]|uniref:accessory gland protein Acp29AB n=1 Tax=Drosophila biarmipes TaxID=125945 RepID=UPI0007E5F42E|nr:accessory gland protein Acp29AB [Drosophila biarmipes]
MLSTNCERFEISTFEDFVRKGLPTKMLKSSRHCIGVLLILAGFFAADSLERSSGSVCLLDNAPAQCGAFCGSLLRPVHDHNLNMQRLWNETQERLDRMEFQLSAIQEALADIRFSAQPKVPVEERPELTTGHIDQFHVGRNALQDWHASESTCHQMGAHLAVFQSQEELDHVNAKLSGQDSYWLGIHNQDSNGTFKWASTGQPARFLDLPANVLLYCTKNPCFVFLHGGRMGIADSSKKANYICQGGDL